MTHFNSSDSQRRHRKICWYRSQAQVLSPLPPQVLLLSCLLLLLLLLVLGLWRWISRGALALGPSLALWLSDYPPKSLIWNSGTWRHRLLGRYLDIKLGALESFVLADRLDQVVSRRQDAPKFTWRKRRMMEKNQLDVGQESFFSRIEVCLRTEENHLFLMCTSLWLGLCFPKLHQWQLHHLCWSPEVFKLKLKRPQLILYESV